MNAGTTLDLRRAPGRIRQRFEYIVGIIIQGFGQRQQWLRAVHHQRPPGHCTGAHSCEAGGAAELNHRRRWGGCRCDGRVVGADAAHGRPRGDRGHSGHGIAQPLPIRIDLPVERQCATYTQAAGDPPDACFMQALDHQQRILVDKIWIASTLDQQVAVERAVVNSPAGRERGHEPMVRAKLAQQCERGRHLRYRRWMHGPAGGLGQQH
jgi:hypothetical protein